jgi:hypothetical protein
MNLYGGLEKGPPLRAFDSPIAQITQMSAEGTIKIVSLITYGVY